MTLEQKLFGSALIIGIVLIAWWCVITHWDAERERRSR